MKPARSLRRTVTLSGVLCISALNAQSVRSVVPDSARPKATGIISRRELAIAGVATLSAVALMPLDRRIAVWSQRPGLQRNATLSNAAAAFRTLGGTGTIVLSLGTYGAGTLMHNRTLADIGLHSGGAIVVGTVVGSLLKGTIGRARPATVSDSTSTDYGFGRGFRRGSAYQSLPSGHTMAAFALASVVASESAMRWPHARRWIAPLVFSAATLVGASRIYNDVHWTSDVVLGAGVGVVSGLAVVRFQHVHPDNVLDRRLLPPNSEPAGAPTQPQRNAAWQFNVGARGVSMNLKF